MHVSKLARYTMLPGVEIVHGEFDNCYEGSDLHDPATPHTVHVYLREGREGTFIILICTRM